MVEDTWLAERLGRPALTVEPGDDPAAVARAARGRAPAFAQAKVPCGDVSRVAALERAGFGVIDVNVTLERAPGPLDGDAAPSAVSVVGARPGHAADVLEIATEHFTVSRFHRDAAIAPEAAAAIKRDWVQAYLDGARGERLLVAEDGGRAIGFLAVLAGARPGEAVIDLIAVHPRARSAGVGRALVAALADRPLRVGTQAANVGSLRFYERLGFTICDTRYVLHLHA